MSTLKKEVLAITAARLAQYKINPPTDLESYVEEVEYSILNYTNLNQVPQELKFVWVNMLIDYFKWVEQHATAKEASSKKSSTPTILSSLREGDTTLGFSADTSSVEYQASNAHKLSDVLDKIVMNYVDSLNRFRRVVW